MKYENVYKKINLKKVAEKAGLSIATVSRVINKSVNVNPQTRIKIEKIIKELNYSPNRVAKRLRNRRTSSNLLAVLIPDIQNPFYIEVLRGIEDTNYKNNNALIVCNFSQDKQKENMYLDIIQSESVDGLIAAPAHEKDQKVIGLVKDGLPIVCVDRGLLVDFVLVNNRKGAFSAVDNLAKKGYKRIAYISGLPQIPSSRQREEGFKDALNSNHLHLYKELVKYGGSGHDSGVKLCKELLFLPNPPDAIFTGNNLITLGVLEIIHKRNLKIPGNIAFIGFDDIVWPRSLNPPLTAVRQPAREIGRRADEFFIQRINMPERASINMILQGKLMKRSSVYFI